MNQSDTQAFAKRVEECLTIEAFRAWLESKDGGDIVGVAGYSWKCPVRKFLLPHFPEKEGETSLDVYGSIILLCHEQEGYTDGAVLPAWATSFIHRVDAEKRESPVTAEESLTILAEVERELVDTSG